MPLVCPEETVASLVKVKENEHLLSRMFFPSPTDTCHCLTTTIVAATVRHSCIIIDRARQVRAVQVCVRQVTSRTIGVTELLKMRLVKRD
ncbi:MAG: hypothetical protein ACI8P9_005165 [Parasphingorhabdus sp.]|jgi:hypothetical protein